MRNLVDAQIRRRGPKSHLFHVVRDHLDLRKYNNNIGQLCRSLRRDDQVYMAFGHVVGKLVCEGLYTKGIRAVNYMQLRIMRQEITRALEEAVSFLMSLDRDIIPDKIGEPNSGSLYQYNDSSLLFSLPDSKKQKTLSDGSSVPASLVHLAPVPTPPLTNATGSGGIGSVFLPPTG